MYDMVFISYEEPNAETNWNALKSRFPNAKRVHGIKGLHKAHMIASNMVTTELFFCVDGDAEILVDFDFSFRAEPHELDHVHVFRARNPINDLVYGYGAVKLLPTEDVRTLTNRDFKTDMTSSINRKYKVVHMVSNVTAFNTDPYNTWRSAFRECAKLASGVIDRQVDSETQQRLEVWCTVGQNREYGHWALLGAQAGRKFGYENQGTENMMKINDWDWLHEQYEKGV